MGASSDKILASAAEFLRRRNFKISKRAVGPEF